MEKMVIVKNNKIISRRDWIGYTKRYSRNIWINDIKEIL